MSYIIELLTDKLLTGRRPSMSDYKDLVVWKNTMYLVEEVYGLCDTLPDYERYGLNSQMRRAVSSISNNIAEAFGRGTWREEVKFLRYAMGSANELETQLMQCQLVHYFPYTKTDAAINRCRCVRKQLNNLIRSIILKWAPPDYFEKRSKK